MAKINFFLIAIDNQNFRGTRISTGGKSLEFAYLSKLTETLYFLSGSVRYADEAGLPDLGVDTTPLRWKPKKKKEKKLLY